MITMSKIERLRNIQEAIKFLEEAKREVYLKKQRHLLWRARSRVAHTLMAIKYKTEERPLKGGRRKK